MKQSNPFNGEGIHYSFRGLVLAILIESIGALFVLLASLQALQHKALHFTSLTSCSPFISNTAFL
jgi:hypothetical protein